MLSAGFSVMGVESERVSEVVREHYTGIIATEELKILSTYIFIGLVVGAWGGLTGKGLALARGNRPQRRIWPWGVGFALLTEALMLSHDLIDTPAVYSPWFYEQGGLLQSIQVSMTDHVTPAPFNAAIIVLYLSGPILYIIGLYRSGRLGAALRPLRSIVSPWAVVVLAVLGSALAYQRCDMAPRERPNQPDIIILATDSLRPDHLGIEYGLPTSPNIDALTGEAAYFTEAYTVLARTFPAWASILSGLSPKEHGIRTMFPRPDQAVLERSLPRLLGEAGWQTVVISDYAGDIFPRFDAGFGEVYAPEFNMKTLVQQRVLEGHKLLLPYITGPLGRRVFPEHGEMADLSDPRILGDRIIDTLHKYRDRPLFLATFFSVTHFPYASPYPWCGSFNDPGYDGPFKYHKQVAPGESITDREDSRQITALFDDTILAFDFQVGRIVDYLKKRGTWNNTILIITSDHGENLFEHGEDIGHGDHFRGMQSLRVPLIVKLAGGNAAGPQPGLVSLLDISPTIAEAAGIDLEWEHEGLSLVPLLRTGRPMDPRELYFETGIWFTVVSPEYFSGRRIPYPDISEMGRIDFGGGHLITIQPEYETIINLAKHRMIFDGRHKLIYMPTQSGIRWELYDVVSDPGEIHDLAQYNPAYLDDMRRRLLAWISSEPGVEISNGFAVPAE